MKDFADQLQAAGADYKAAREEAERRMAQPREELTKAVRAAYKAGWRKADIIRAIGHVWSRQWIDDTVRDITAAQPAPVRRTRRS